MANKEKGPIWTKNFLAISITNFFVFIVFYAHLVTLPIYVVNNMQRSNAEAGLVVTVFLIASIFFTPLSGKILEKYGKKEVLIICTTFFLIVSVIYIWVNSFALLLLLRFFHGIWFSILTTATGAIAADIVPHTRRGEGLGYFAMSMNIAVVVGPFIALTLLQSSTFELLFVVLTVILAGSVVFTCMLKVTKPSESNKAVKKGKFTFDDLFERKVMPIAFVGGLVAFCYSGVISFVSIFAQQKNLSETANYYFLFSALAMLISRPFVGRQFDVKGPKYVMYPAFILFAVGLFTLSFTNSSYILLLSGVLIGLGYGSLLPCFQTLAVQSVNNNRSSYATATFFTLFDGGVALGSFLLGIIGTLLGYEKLYFITSLLVMVTFFLFSKLHFNSKQHSPQTSET